MKNPQAIKKALERAADRLEAANANSKINSKELSFVSGAIRLYLAGKEPTLDHAFGLKKHRGKHERPCKCSAKELDDVRKAIDMLFATKKPWYLICELLGYDKKGFKPVWDRCRHIVIDEMSEKISLDDILE